MKRRGTELTQLFFLNFEMIRYEWPQFSMKGKIECSECGMAFEMEAKTLDMDEHVAEALFYVWIAAGAAFCQVVLTIKQMDASNTPSALSKMSLLCIGEQAVLDAYLLLMNLTFGLNTQSVYNAFALVAFFKLILFSLFEMRMLMSVWKARRPAAFNQGWTQVRRELGTLYMRFYGFILGGILLVYQLKNMFYVFVFLLYSFWIPQIYCSARRDTKHPFKLYYIVGMSVSRLAVPLYFYGYAGNMVRSEPSALISMALIAYVSLQVIVMHLQDVFGPRFFIPARYLPEKYNYQRSRTHLNGENGEINCVICMSPVEQDDLDYMLTPCDHLFHKDCLERWMDIKLECPTCRAVLEPI
eukprot:TRINITY_DN2212_c2_g1_i4.p1 TRINITY_DN2212_c2_g1~~TRINITY_DN2212_c2_g1_i4.p1  ORF type:complete len:356 (+),score=97.75 TRINITY_DN2212_c2_g1_i4:101-1168(+)